ncbi:MAG: 23S rRNA (uracil(1939)-C(5))-methyltransferase RlmD [Tannerella sp.]|nr:23S rRNA (uracil(1939)-C(5))-methyltransferase RlmD [Tannerella sp.]
MGHKKKELPVLEKVEITDVAAEGKALAKVNDMVVFVPWAAPGDIADIQLTRKKNSYAEGRAVRFHKYSEERSEPFCEHFTICGGCKWQHLPYETQLKYKHKQVIDNLARIGKVEAEEIYPIAGSEQTTLYRNKLEYTFSNKRWLTDEEISSDTTFNAMDGAGFHIPGMFDKVLDIRKCLLQDDISNRIRLFVKDFCIASRYPFFDLRVQNGFIRTLIVRTSSNGEVMIIVVFFEDDKEKRERLLNAVKDNFPEITSLMYVINSKCNDTITDREVLTFHGKDHFIEEMEGLQFKVGPKSFYQTNSRQAYRLYSIVREFAGLTGNETVYDLYTGTGTIANFIARNAKKVTGIEYVPEAIEDAVINARLNHLDNTEFFAGDMKDLLTSEFIARHGQPDVIITDPPRAGMHDDVTDIILATAPERIVYVSCNPATQARDLNRLSVKYRVCKVQPVDMFPHTHHVENVALLILR